jgi:hypothetical protein
MAGQAVDSACAQAPSTSTYENDSLPGYRFLPFSAQGIL